MAGILDKMKFMIFKKINFIKYCEKYVKEELKNFTSANVHQYQTIVGMKMCLMNVNQIVCYISLMNATAAVKL
jgi:hypothetical protein